MLVHGLRRELARLGAARGGRAGTGPGMTFTKMIWPESNAESPLKACDRDRFRPRLSRQESDNDPVVDPGRIGNPAHTLLPHRLAQVQDQEADHFGIRALARPTRPLICAHRWGGGRVASHRPSLSTAVAIAALPHTSVSGGPYGVQYHQPSRATSPTKQPGGLR